MSFSTRLFRCATSVPQRNVLLHRHADNGGGAVVLIRTAAVVRESSAVRSLRANPPGAWVLILTNGSGVRCVAEGPHTVVLALGRTRFWGADDHRLTNCSCSVEPFKATVELRPPWTICVISSK